MASTWHRVADGDLPDEGRVRAVEADGRAVRGRPAGLAHHPARP
ncbi:MAG TPA: hypothetical protein VGN18_18615 [Jatrophihabitans sp.]|jgi:hypothetical protein|nr:hypothetical protein [Jatrophihabitans sp.]